MTHRLLFLIFAFALSGCLSNQKDSDPDFYLGGIMVNEPDHQHWVEQLDRAGMNTVSVTLYGKQGNWDSDHFWSDGIDEAVISEIRHAKKQGLKVALIIRVALDHAPGFSANKFMWHGMIMPKTEAQLANWFLKYGDFVMEIAEMAEMEGVEVLSIGSELRSLSATSPVWVVPDLEEYYLNPNKQAAYKSGLLRFDK